MAGNDSFEELFGQMFGNQAPRPAAGNPIRLRAGTKELLLVTQLGRVTVADLLTYARRERLYRRVTDKDGKVQITRVRVSEVEFLSQVNLTEVLASMYRHID